MITVETRTATRHLRAQGRLLRVIARELGLSRNTDRATLRQDAPPNMQGKLAQSLDESAELMYDCSSFESLCAAPWSHVAVMARHQRDHASDWSPYRSARRLSPGLP